MSFVIGKDCQIHPTAVINVKTGFIGDRAVINEHVKIEGTHVEIGHEAFIDRYATIGGGSAFDPQSKLKAGDWLHMGAFSHINTARGVFIGHEFGCGIDTKIFTHGAYTDSYRLGAPVEWGPVYIGDSVWMPNAWVNPNTTIGNNVVIAARSLVNKNIPDGCLAGGTPVKIIKENYLPRVVDKEKLIRDILLQIEMRLANTKTKYNLKYDNLSEIIQVFSASAETNFNLLSRSILGSEQEISMIVKDQLRRNGIRFRCLFGKNQWTTWT
jgi:acetyltransferase-like isoleucine patch superfamily enzyme